MTTQDQIPDTDLDRHSPLHLVVRTMLAWCEELSGNEHIYDDKRGFSISVEEAKVIVQHLSFVDMCSINVSDNARLLDDLFAEGADDSFNWRHIASYRDAVNEGDAIAVIWQIDDIISRAGELGMTITDDQARDILSLMSHKHDANIGISWDVIDYYLAEGAG